MLPTHVCPQPTVSWPPSVLILEPCRLTDQQSDTPSPGRASLPATENPQTRLEGSSILLVEDEAMIAMDIAFALTDAGATVLGPAATLADGLSLAHDTSRIDGAILDIDLDGEEVFQLADFLASRAVPFLFHTGGALISGLEARFPDASVLRKPVAVDDLLWSLIDQMS